VFVSSDRDEEAFKEYFASMPWLALPFAERDTKANLSKKFGVNDIPAPFYTKAVLSKKFDFDGIPALIILDENGEVVNKDGRSCVMEDPSSWKPPTLWEALSGDLLGKEGDDSVDEVRAQSEVIALYFSAHW